MLNALKFAAVQLVLKWHLSNKLQFGLFNIHTGRAKVSYHVRTRVVVIIYAVFKHFTAE